MKKEECLNSIIDKKNQECVHVSTGFHDDDLCKKRGEEETCNGWVLINKTEKGD